MVNIVPADVYERDMYLCNAIAGKPEHRRIVLYSNIIFYHKRKTELKISLAMAGT